MKPVFFICGILLSFFQANAQLKVDAGNDVIVCCCANNEREEIIKLGGCPVASGGVEPYTFTWSGKIYGFQYPFTYPRWIYASDILDDTTQSNPTFKRGDVPDEDWFIFHLKVEDAVGNVQVDSVKILRSIFMFHPIYKLPITIHRGDSVKLFGDIYFESNFMPLVGYKLSPSYGLTDPTDLYGWAKPDTSIMYSLQAVNSAGCVSYKIEYWRVNVDTTTALNNVVGNPETQCYLDHGILVINMPGTDNLPYELTVTTIGGRTVHTGKYSNSVLKLSNLGLKQNHMYVVSIFNSNERSVFKLLNNLVGY